MDFTAERVFLAANSLALGGWLLLAAGIALRSPLLRDVAAGIAVPALLAVGYTAIIAVHWSGAQGDFSSLAGVAALFGSPWVLLAGWIHYLAFDLFIGSWVARDAAERGVPRLLVVPVLPLVFLFGPAGFLAWLGVRTAHRAVTRTA